MSSKNNPENRGRVTELRTFNGKKCVPVKLRDIPKNQTFIAAAYEDNRELVVDTDGNFIPYKNL